MRGTILAEKIMVNLWERFTHIYGSRFTAMFGESAICNGSLTDVAKTWAFGLSDLAGEQLSSGLKLCVTRDSTWPPNLPEFLQMCIGKSSNGFGLDYTPECYRSHESRPDRILESDHAKERRIKAGEINVAEMRKILGETL